MLTIRNLHIVCILLLITPLFLFLPGCQDLKADEHQAVSNDTIKPGSESNYQQLVSDQNLATQEEMIGAHEIPLNVTIGLYNGIGSWDLNVRALKNFLNEYRFEYSLIDENDLNSENLSERYDLIWFPGGFAAEYRYYIINHQPLIKFVAEGGALVGSCAGAYFVADIFSWMGNDHDYPLDIFSGTASGPLSGEIGWGNETILELNREITFNNDFEERIPVYYFDGPYFTPHGDNPVTILASYAVNDKPAVIAGRFESGKYLLFGPHPELGGYDAETGDYDVTGGNNAQWPWLESAIQWFAGW